MILIQLAVILSVGWIFTVIGQRLRIGAFAGAMIAGLLLGPAVLGQLSPYLYRLAFNGGPEAVRIEKQMTEYQASQKQARDKLVESGVSEAAVVEHDADTGKSLQQFKADLQKLEDRDREERHNLYYFGAVGWLIIAGLGAHLGRYRQFIVDALPPTILALALVTLFGAGLLWLLRTALPEYLDQRNLSFDGITMVSVICICACCALPCGNPAIARLKQKDSPIHDLPALASITVVLLALISCGALAVIRYAYHGMDHSEQSPTTFMIGAVWVVGVTVVMLGLVGPGLRWAFRYFRITDRSWGLRIALGAIFVACLYVGLGSHPIWAALLAAVTLSWTIETPCDNQSPGISDEALPWPGIILAVIAMMEFGDWRQANVLMVLVALVIMGDGKAIGSMLAVRWFGGRSWKEAMRFGVALSAAGPMTVLLMYGLYIQGPINQTLFASLLAAALILAAMNRPVLALIDRWWSDSPDQTLPK